MELQVNEIKALEPVKFNYEQLKQEITTKVENYKSIVYTEDNIKEAKSDRANLNKLAKALNDEKIRVKNTVLAPYLPFEKQCNELIELVKEASTHADTQIKNYEQQAKDEKLKQIINYFMENVGDYSELIDFDKIFNEKWLNVTYKMDQIEKDISHIIAKTKTDLAVIDSQFKEESINQAAKMEYFNNIANPTVLTMAMLKGNKMADDAKKLEELKQKEESTQLPTKSEVNVENSSQNTVQNEVRTEIKENSSQELMTIDFTITVTPEKMQELKKFLVMNHITPIRGITKDDVELILSKIEDRIQYYREEGKTDLRNILHYVQSINENINNKGVKETTILLRKEE